MATVAAALISLLVVSSSVPARAGARTAHLDQASATRTQAPQGRNYLIGKYDDPADVSTPALMGYPWAYTIGGSYQES